MPPGPHRFWHWQLVLDGGVPQEFLTRSEAPSEPALTYDGVAVGYRNDWWQLPGGDLAAMGDHGQIMVVCRSTGTVVVRMGDDDGPNVALALRLQQLAQRVVD
ncbi:MAG: hypothetical protein ABS81_14315 [Pseudonocardia sp. SCN 72-86]|nr:MAG: hypothetical protein ABS81_14315 [Pseudonocardia sp. SCN 72-86]